MKANRNKMFSVALDQLDPGQGASFPLYVFLPKNDRMVPLRQPGDPLGRELFEELRQAGHAELWVPEEFRAAIAPAAEAAPPAPAQVQAAEIPTALGPLAKMLSELREIREAGEDARREVAMRLRDEADKILAKAAPANPLYEEVAAMRALADPTEHSVFVGSVAAALASFAYGEQEWLADLVAAASLHDIGIARISFDVGAAPRVKWSAEERREYEKHVSEGMALLETADPAFPPELLRFVGGHHEHCDGAGFPGGLKEEGLHRGALALGLADHFDRLLRGDITGMAMSPAEAFGRLEMDLISGHFSRALLEKLSTLSA